MAAQIDELLTECVKRDGSDLHIKADSPPLLRIYGDLYSMNLSPLTPTDSRELTYSVMTEEQIALFERDWEMDLGYDIEGVGRFRVNAFVQRGNVGSVFRSIPLRLSTMEELGLPAVCKYFADRPRGRPPCSTTSTTPIPATS
jgi:twitching motility protein PilT